MRSLYILTFLFLCLSCSYRELILKQAPDLLSEQVNDYLLLNEVQEKELKLKVTGVFFSQYKEVKQLRDILKTYDIKKGQSRATVIKAYPPYNRILKEINKIAIGVLLKLTYEQRQALVIKRTNIKEDAKENYTQVGVKRLQSIFGELNKQQLDLIGEYAKQYQSERSHVNTWHDSFIKTLKIKEQNRYKNSLEKNFSGTESLESILKSSHKFFIFFDKFCATLTDHQVASFDKKRKDALNWLNLYIQIYETPLKS